MMQFYCGPCIHYYNYTRLTAFFPRQPGQAGTAKVNQSGFIRQEMKGFGDAVASDGPYANNLHLAPNR